MLSTVRFVALSAVCLTLLSSSVAQELDGTLRCSSDFTSGTISASNTERRYRLSISSFADREITIDTCSTVTNFDTVLEIFPNDDFSISNRIDRNDDRPSNIPIPCSSLRSYISSSLPGTGDYYIRVTGTGGRRTGRFGLQLRCGGIIPQTENTIPSITFDSTTGGVLAGAVITYIVLGTVLPCVIICVCIACCVHYSQKSSRTTVVQPMPVVQQGAVVVQTGSYPQQQVVQPVPVAQGGATPMQQPGGGTSFYPAMQPAAQPSPMLQPQPQPVQTASVQAQPQATPSAPPPAYNDI